MTELPARRVKDCRDPWTSAVIGADGSVMPCCHAVERMGDLGEATFDEIWDGARFRTFRTFLASTTPLPACETCFVRGWKSEPASRPGAGQPAWRRFLEGLGLGPKPVDASDGPLHLAVWTGQPTSRRGEVVSVNLSFTASRLPAGERLDLFLTAEGPAGDRHFLTYNGRFLDVTAVPKPLLGRIEPLDVEQLELRHVPPGDPPHGPWRLSAVLVRADRGVDDLPARLAAATCIVTFV